MRHSIYWSVGRRLVLLRIKDLRCDSDRYDKICHSIYGAPLVKKIYRTHLAKKLLNRTDLAKSEQI